MGRPDQNPGVSHAQPAPGPIGIPSQLPITGAASNRPSKWTSELFDCMNVGENGLHGWSGNVQRQRMGQQQGIMAPPMGQRMMG
ncbi:unnamed protein product [Brassica oleracea]